MEDIQKENSDKNKKEWFVIMPKEYRFDSNIEQVRAEHNKKIEKIVERESLVIIVFIVIFTFALIITSNLYFSLLAICGYPLYLIIRFVVWRNKN